MAFFNYIFVMFCSEFESFGAMYKALTALQVDGIFIDQHVGSHHMSRLSDSNLRIMTSFPSDILYRIAFLSIKSKDMMTYKCFEEAIEHASLQHILQKYVTPSKVGFQVSHVSPESQTRKGMCRLLCG